MNHWFFIFSVFVWANNLYFAYGQSDNDIQETDKNSTTFVLPPRDNVFILFRKVIRHEPFFLVEVNFTSGSHEFFRHFLYKATDNWLMMHITKKWVSFTEQDNYQIPELNQTLQGRRVKVLSYNLIQWQMFVLPVEPSDKIDHKILILGLEVACSILALALLSVLLALCYLKKKKTSRTQQKDPNTTAMSEFQSGIPDEKMNTPGDLRPQLPRPGSSHDSENSIYGAAIR